MRKYKAVKLAVFLAAVFDQSAYAVTAWRDQLAGITLQHAET
jgi:hypothetical protein